MPESEFIYPLCAAAYAAKKAELAEERRRREAEREAAKEARKQRMRDYMEKNLLEVGAPFRLASLRRGVGLRNMCGWLQGRPLLGGPTIGGSDPCACPSAHTAEEAGLTRAVSTAT